MINEFLQKIREAYEKILGENLVGIYIHGSVAFGCYRDDVSDVDFLVVVRDTPTLSEKIALIETILRLKAICPKKGAEMSVVLSRACDPFIYPTPYVLHYSNAHLDRIQRDITEYCMNMNGTDKDLAAHFTVTKAVGFVLCGKPIAEVFGAVSAEDYLDSIRFDVENAVLDILENPVYVILNLCRVLAFMRDGVVISKKDGGLWGLSRLSMQYHEAIRAAFASYAEGVPYVWSGTEQDFAAYMHQEIFGKK